MLHAVAWYCPTPDMCTIWWRIVEPCSTLLACRDGVPLSGFWTRLSDVVPSLVVIYNVQKYCMFNNLHEAAIIIKLIITMYNNLGIITLIMLWLHVCIHNMVCTYAHIIQLTMQYTLS